MDTAFKPSLKQVDTELEGNAVRDLFSRGMGVESKHQPGVKSPRIALKQLRTLSVGGRRMQQGYFSMHCESSAKALHNPRGIKCVDIKILPAFA